MLYNIGSIRVDTPDVPSDIKIIKISIYLTLVCLFHNVIISI
nr:ALPV-030 [Albatrosspox virus]